MNWNNIPYRRIILVPMFYLNKNRRGYLHNVILECGHKDRVMKSRMREKQACFDCVKNKPTVIETHGYTESELEYFRNKPVNWWLK